MSGATTRHGSARLGLDRLARELISPVLAEFGIERQGRSSTFVRKEANGDEVVFQFEAFPLGNDGYSFTNQTSMTPALYDRWLEFEGKWEHDGVFNAFWIGYARSDSPASQNNLWEFAADDHESADAFGQALERSARFLTSLLDPAVLAQVVAATPYADARLRMYPRALAIALAQANLGDLTGLRDSLRDIEALPDEKPRVFARFLRSTFPV